MTNRVNDGEAKSAVRVVQILERLSDGDDPTLARLARDLEAPKSSIHSVVQTLIGRGWVRRDAIGRLCIGTRALLVGCAHLDADPVVAMTSPVLDDLAAQLDETVHLGRLVGDDIVYLAKRESTQPLRMFSAVGRRLPAHATALGKVLLAHLPEDELQARLPERLEALTDATITDRAELRAHLALVREQGWAADHGENSEGIACLAVALPMGDPPQDALSCSVPTVRFGPERREGLLRHLMRARDDLAEVRGRRSSEGAPPGPRQ